MEIDTDKIGEAVLGLLYLTLHDGRRAWKGHDWDALDRLHRKSMIHDPIGKTKSVMFTAAGLRESGSCSASCSRSLQRWISRLFGSWRLASYFAVCSFANHLSQMGSTGTLVLVEIAAPSASTGASRSRSVASGRRWRLARRRPTPSQGASMPFATASAAVIILLMAATSCADSTSQTPTRLGAGLPIAAADRTLVTKGRLESINYLVPYGVKGSISGTNWAVPFEARDFHKRARVIRDPSLSDNIEPQQLWLSALDPVVAAASGSTGSEDYMSLFSSDAAWPVVSSQTNVFKISTQFALNAPATELQQIITYLNEHHIALALEALIQPSGSGNIGDGVEGFSAPGTMRLVAQRIASLGGTLDYVAMDEPLYFGHQYTGANAPQESITAVAEGVAAGVSEIKAVFPSVEIGDIEPIPETLDISQWLTAFKQATGQNLAFFDADVSWSSPWQSSLEALSQELSNNEITFGVIVNGNASDTSGAQWDLDALQNFVSVEVSAGLHPAQVIVQTWESQPTHVLPEDSLGTLTNLALTVLDAEPILQNAFGAPDIGGTLPFFAPAGAWVIDGASVSVSTLGIALGGGDSSDATYLIVLVSGSGVFAAVPSGAGAVSGSGSSCLILSGSLADVTAELAAAIFTESTATSDQIEVAAFNSLGQFGESLVSVQGASAIPLSVPMGLSLQQLYENVFGTASVPAGTQISDVLAGAEMLIASVYEQIYGHGPDASGLASWANGLLNGLPLSVIREDFATSSGTTQTITEAFEGVTGQPPTVTELATAEAELSSGTPLNAVEAPLLAQANSEITQLYLGVLGRAPDPTGLASWSNGLLSGLSLTTVRADIANSGEAAQDITTLVEQATGNAPAAAVLTGLQDWLAAGMSLQQLSSLVASFAQGTGLAALASAAPGQPSPPDSLPLVAPGEASVIAGASVSLSTLGIALSGADSADVTYWIVLTSGGGVFAAEPSGAGTISGGGSSCLVLSGSLADVTAELAATTFTEGTASSDQIEVAAFNSIRQFGEALITVEGRLGTVLLNGTTLALTGVPPQPAQLDWAFAGPGLVNLANNLTLDLGAPLTAPIELNGGDALTLAAGVAAGGSVVFAGTGDVLSIDLQAGTQLIGGISGFSSTDTIIVAGSVTAANNTPAGVVLQDGTAALGTIELTGIDSGDGFLTVPVSDTSTEIMLYQASIEAGAGTATVTPLAGAMVSLDQLLIDPSIAPGGTIDALKVGGPGTIEAVGTVTIDNLEAAAGSNVMLDGAFIATDPVTIDAQGNITGFGTLLGVGTVNGTIAPDGGTLVISGAEIQLGVAAGTDALIAVNGDGNVLATQDSPLSIGTGGSGTVLITNGGALSGAGGLLLGAASVGSGQVTVTGAGSTLDNTGPLVIGDSGTGALFVTAGGSLTTTPAAGATGPAADIAADPGSDGSATTVSGARSDWSISGSLVVGDAAVGSLAVTQGGNVGASSLTLGNVAGGVGAVSVSGTASVLTLGTGLVVGAAGTGDLSITDGATLAAASGTIGLDAGGSGVVDIQGSGSRLDISGDLDIGEAGVGVLVMGAGTTLSVEGDLNIGPDGELIQFGGVIDPADFTNHGTLGGTGSDSISGTLTNDGVYFAQSGTYELDVGVLIDGAGTLAVNDGGDFVLNAGSVADTQQVVFNNTTAAAVLTIGTIGTFGAVLENFNTLASIVLAEPAVGSDAYTAGTDGADGALTLYAGPSQTGGVIGTLAVAPDISAGALAALEMVNAGTIGADPPCFAAGTRIATPQGEVAVEALRPGDLVCVLGQPEPVPVLWVGHRRLDCRRHPRPRAVWPVRVVAGAFGPGRPRRDLLLSPDHALFLEGVLIPVKYLIDGAMIAPVPVDAVTYYHVELPRHAVLLAEGLAAESYLDTGERGNFANGGRATALYPDFAVLHWETKGCAPLVVTGEKVEAARRSVLKPSAVDCDHVGRCPRGRASARLAA